jgi:hypothetical protein
MDQNFDISFGYLNPVVLNSADPPIIEIGSRKRKTNPRMLLHRNKGSFLLYGLNLSGTIQLNVTNKTFDIIQISLVACCGNNTHASAINTESGKNDCGLIIIENKLTGAGLSLPPIAPGNLR